MTDATTPAATGGLETLRALVEGAAAGTGEEFFRSLVRHLAAATGTRHAFVAEFAGGNTRVRTRAYWSGGRIAPNVEFDLAGTPCEEVVKGSLCHHPADVKRLFPRDRALVEMGVESYLGAPLRDAARKRRWSCCRPSTSRAATPPRSRRGRRTRCRARRRGRGCGPASTGCPSHTAPC
jgi:hypothetical protein